MIKYRIVGNMLWNTVAAVPPRQVTPVEREMVTEIEFWHRQFDAISHILRAEEQNLALDLAAQKAMEAVDELARVRGLLQHYGVHKADCGTWDVTYGDRESSELMAKACDCGLTAELSNFQPSSSLVPQGAESADIGKPDSADETLKQLLTEHVTHCNPRFPNLTEYGQKCANHADELARKYLRELDPRWTTGSAETGGKKEVGA
jgi:hypothetical protein